MVLRVRAGCGICHLFSHSLGENLFTGPYITVAMGVERGRGT